MTDLDQSGFEDTESMETATQTVSVVSEPNATAHERRVRVEMDQQFRRLKDESRAIFGLVKGRPGVRSPQKWAELLEKAGDEIGNGKFLVRQLGAENYLAPETVAVLITLRQNLIAELDKPSTAKIMQIDAAILAYFNLLRTQSWIGNLALVTERQLFGEAPLNQIHGPRVGDMLEEQLRRLAEVMLPLQDRAHRQMTRSLSAIG
jgi:hypothetical protein